MKNTLYNRAHIFEYLLYGSLAALGYVIFVVIFLLNRRYENSYLLYFGNVAFVTVIGIHAFLQINRPHEGKSAVRMLISSHLAALTGVVLAVGLSLVSMVAVFGDLGSTRAPNELVANTNAWNQISRPSGMLPMILIYATVCNFAVSSFITVLVSYVCKKNQTKDKPAELDENIHMSEQGN